MVKFLMNLNMLKKWCNQYPECSWNKVEVGGDVFINEVEKMHRLIEWPTFSTGTINQYALLHNCHKNGEHIIWDGLGADAIYGGHDSYRYRLIWEYLIEFKIASAKEVIGWKGNYLKELNSLAKFLVKSKIASYRWLKSSFERWLGEHKLYNSEFLKLSLQNVEKHRGPESVTARMKNDYFNGGVRHLSRFTDRISRHLGLKMKYPFAENVKWAHQLINLPRKDLYKSGVPKALLRASFSDKIPSEIIQRKDKMGLVSPNNLWIDLYKDIWIKYMEGSGWNI